MTVNDQHIAICEQLLLRASGLMQALESMQQILRECPPSKRDRLARQTTIMMNEVMRLVSSAESVATLTERALRYSRIGTNVEDDD